MEFKANSGIWGTMFGVPCIVADNLLKLATGEQLKVLLYLLRHSGEPASSTEIAQNTGLSPEQAEEAVMFWQQVNIISADTAPLTSSIMAPPPAPEVKAAPAAEDKPIKTAPVRKREHLYPSEISDLMKSSSEIAELLKVAEASLGSLNNTMQNSLVWMYNYLGLRSEVIITLLNYCVMIEKTHPKLIEELAVSWSENDINTLEAAQREVERLSNLRSFTGQISIMFGLNAKPTSKQRNFINSWSAQGFSLELIKVAYETTVESINQINFKYIDSILNNWKESGIYTADEARKALENRSNEYAANKKKDKKAPSDGFNAEKYEIFVNNF